MYEIMIHINTSNKVTWRHSLQSKMYWHKASFSFDCGIMFKYLEYPLHLTDKIYIVSLTYLFKLFYWQIWLEITLLEMA